MSADEKKPAARPKVRPPTADMAYVLVRMLKGDPLVHRQGTGSSGWWTLGVNAAAAEIDEKVATGLLQRGLTRAKSYRPGRFETAFELTEAGRDLAATLPAPDPDYRTPKERREASRRRRGADAAVAALRASAQRQAQAAAERRVLDAVDAYFRKTGSLDALEEAWLELERLRAAPTRKRPTAPLMPSAT